MDLEIPTKLMNLYSPTAHCYHDAGFIVIQMCNLTPGQRLPVAEDKSKGGGGISSRKQRLC